ncbi:MAG: hypothetical protein V3U49_00770 [Nitrososphaerales archaeon]
MFDVYTVHILLLLSTEHYRTMNITNPPEHLGKDRMEGLSLEFRLTEPKESRNVMLERIVNKVERRSSEGMVTPTTEGVRQDAIR